MKAALLFALISLAGLVSAEADLGETVTTVEARWGAPVAASPEKRQYRNGNLTLEVTYLSGISVSEAYWKEAVPTGTKTPGFSTQEVQEYRARYGDGQGWASNFGATRWLRADRLVTCTIVGDAVIFRDERHAELLRR